MLTLTMAVCYDSDLNRQLSTDKQKLITENTHFSLSFVACHLSSIPKTLPSLQFDQAKVTEETQCNEKRTGDLF